MPKKHPRPSHEFTVTSLAWERDIEANYRSAGFDPIPDEVLVCRFWQFLRFIQQRGLTTRIVVHSAAQIADDTALLNSDHTDEGFYFIKRFHGRWLNRVRRHRGEAKEDAFLTKWHDQFLLQSDVGRK